jgi:cytochrome c oxidase assembly protein subunit 15
MNATASAQAEPGALRAVRWLAALGAVLVGVVIASSAWMRHEQAGLRCDDRPACYRPAGAKAQAATPMAERTPARLAHRVSATAVTAAIAGVLLIGWAARPLPRGVVSSALGLAALTALLAVVGTRGMHLDLPIVTLANLVGGMVMLALFGRLFVKAAPASAVDIGSAAGSGAAADAAHGAGPGGRASAGAPSRVPRLLVFALLAQVTLGGLVSAHFAGLACSHDPWCSTAGAASWSMQAWSPLASPGDPAVRTPSQAAAMAALQGAHRLFGLAVAGLALAVAIRTRRVPRLRTPGNALAVLALAQPLVGLGIAAFELPHLGVLAHNAGGALLLLCASVLAARPAAILHRA